MTPEEQYPLQPDTASERRIRHSFSVTEPRVFGLLPPTRQIPLNLTAKTDRVSATLGRSFVSSLCGCTIRMLF